MDYKEKLKELTTTNPKLVLNNKRIDIEEPHQIELTFKEKIIMAKGDSIEKIIKNIFNK